MADERKMSPEEMKKIHIDIQKRAFSKMSTYLTVRALLAQTDKMENKDINWDLLNEFVKSSNDYDSCYNIIEPVFYSRETMTEWVIGSDRSVIEADLAVPFRKIVCKDCGKEFTLTLNEYDWYEKKGLTIPKRCKECIKAKRERFGN